MIFFVTFSPYMELCARQLSRGKELINMGLFCDGL